MNQLFPLPIYTFLKIAIKNGGFSIKRLKNIVLWMVKLVLLEPLRWVELATQQKRINRHVINVDPVFILGFYRSGTSYLHEFITQDERFGYHTNFQMVFPEIMLSCEKWLSPSFDFIFRLFKIFDPVHRVPLSFRFPGEEDGAMTTALNPRGAGWGYFFPKKMMDYFHKFVLFENMPNAEIEAWARDYIFLLKKISIASESKPLVLKSPPNTARIKLLLTIFPNAKFIFIHRNPYEVYASNKKFLQVTHGFYAVGGTKSIDFNQIILDTYTQTMQRYVQEKDLIPAGHLIELVYDDFVKAPVANLKKVYEALNLNDFSICEAKMSAFAARQKTFSSLQHHLPEEERRVATEKLEPFLRRWNYPLQ
ncbi:sulfotransferase family protein [Haliscomenobacter sp.]|uniref:sulfotransferase family protein n=1 Tax=Haliscomenobacter sp. TaxID=2717303 RepID=UPI003BAC4795